MIMTCVQIFILFGKLEEIVSKMQNGDEVNRHAFDYK